MDHLCHWEEKNYFRHLEVCESNVGCCHGECILQNNKSKKRREEEIWAQLKGEAQPSALIFSKTVLEHQSYKVI